MSKNFSIEKLVNSVLGKKTNSDLDILKVFIKYSSDKHLVKKSAEAINEFIEVDLSEMESIINPDKFIFKNEDIDTISVEK